MNNSSMYTNPSTMPRNQSSAQNIDILPQNYWPWTQDSGILTSDRTTTTTHLDIDTSQQMRHRYILPKPSTNSELGMNNATTIPHAATNHAVVEDDRPTVSATGEFIGARTVLRWKNPKSISHNESTERIEQDEDLDSEHVDSEHVDSEHVDSEHVDSGNEDFEGDTEPSALEPNSTSPTLNKKARKADTMFTKTELIALGVAYAVVPSWPLTAEYFPHRTPRSLYQTFKLNFTHAGNGHALARDSYPPNANIPEMRKKLQALRKLGSRTRRVLEEDLPKEYEEDIIRGPLSLSRWQKGATKQTTKSKEVRGPKTCEMGTTNSMEVCGTKACGEITNSREAREPKPRSVNWVHMQAPEEEWEDEDDDSDVEGVRTAVAAIVKTESTIVKTEPDQVNSTPLSEIPESLIIGLNTPPQSYAPSSDVRELSGLAEIQSEPTFESIKNTLAKQVFHCKSEDELVWVLTRGLESLEVKPDVNRRKIKSGRSDKRKRMSGHEEDVIKRRNIRKAL